MLSNKVIIVTGGAGLIGKKIVEMILLNKGIPIIADNDELRGNEVAENIGGFFKVLDISNDESIENLIEWVAEKFGKVDAIVNNAYPRNKNYGRIFDEVEYTDFCENVNLHLGGYFLVSKQVCKFFLKQGYGNVLNISSIYGVVAPRFEIYDNTNMTMPVEYSVIKSGIIHLSKYIAKYYKGKNIRCNSLSLGGIKNSQPKSFLKAYKNFALNKGMLEPSDIVGSLAFLLSDQSEFINGQNIVVDDGWTL